MHRSSIGNLKETLIVGGLASLLMLVLSWPAFTYYFFGEAFWSLRIYNSNNQQLVQAAFSRIDGMFFRPGFFFAHIWWNFVLPPDPLVYHIRNFLFCALNLFILHRVLLKFVRNRPARIIAVALFAASKMHLTIIGYINIFEASILLMTILLAVLCWHRYIESRRTSDYLLALVFCTFSIYSKDNGFAVVGILAAMIVALAIKRGAVQGQIKYWSIRFAPFLLVSVSYVVLRYVLTGPLNTNNPVYSPQLSVAVTILQIKGFLATVGNLSLTNPGTMGVPGISRLLAGDAALFEIFLCAGLWLLIIYTLWRSRASWRLLIVPLVWIGLYLAPTFLIRNHQVYYYQEPLVGLVLLIGICLDRARRPLLTTWSLVVALVAINGLISNQDSYYHWQGTADRAEIVKPLLVTYKSNPPKSIVLVTSPERRDFWLFAIGGPMIPHLLGSPDTTVEVVGSIDSISPDAHVYYLPE